jgi:hypothetical protein
MALDQQDSFGSHSRLLHSPVRPLVGGRTPDREQVGAVAVSFVRPAPRSQSGHFRLASGRLGTGVQPLQGENYTYCHVLDHVQL